MPLYILITFLTIINFASAQIYRYPAKNFNEIGRFNFEVKNMPRVRNQHDIGLCYAFTATAMLEFYNCKKKKIVCKNMATKNSYSALDVTARLSRGGIKEGGVTKQILKNLERVLKVSSEKCAPYSQLEIDIARVFSNKIKHSWENGAERGIDILEKFHKQVIQYGNIDQMSDQSRICQDIFLKSILPLRASRQQVIKALNKSILDEFLYEMLIPLECRGNNYLDILAYKTHHYPKIGESVSYESILQKVESVVKSGNIINLNFCPRFIYSKKYNKEVCAGHAVVVNGIKEVCNKKKECKTLIKIHNSYGENWQKRNHDGWVEAKPIIFSALRRQKEHGRSNILSWITSQGEGVSRTKRRSYKENRAVRKPWSPVSPLLLRDRKSQRGRPKGKPVFKCKGDIGFSFRYKGPHCEVVRYVR